MHGEKIVQKTEVKRAKKHFVRGSFTGLHFVNGQINYGWRKNSPKIVQKTEVKRAEEIFVRGAFTGLHFVNALINYAWRKNSPKIVQKNRAKESRRNVCQRGLYRVTFC